VTIGAYYQILSEFAPDCLMAYPSSLETLCRLLQQSNRQITVPLVLCSSEMLTNAVRSMAQETLNARVVDYYGQAERVNFAYSFELNKYHFLCGYSWTELVLVEEGDTEAVYEIVGTSFWNLAFPIVRYRTGDCISFPRRLSDEELLSVQLGVVPFQGIEGRQTDYLLSPEGGRLIGINHIPRDVDHVVRMQVIQERLDWVRILVIPDAGFSEADRQQILANARLKIPESMEISVELVESLERTAQAKTPFVIRRIG
jgi:phenylacetate-CoA ligase